MSPARRRRARARSVLSRILRAARRRPLLALALLLGLALAFALRQWPSVPRELVQRALEPASLARVESYAPFLIAAAAEQGLDPNLLAGIMYAESRGRIDAVSSAGALGLMQLVPAAASDAARALRLPEPSSEELLSNAELNIRLGARHFAWTLANEERDIERALCAYNAGRGRLAGWIREAGSYRKWRAKQLRDGDSKVLQYALAVLDYAETFRRRGHVAVRAGEGNSGRSTP